MTLRAISQKGSGARQQAGCVVNFWKSKEKRSLRRTCPAGPVNFRKPEILALGNFLLRIVLASSMPSKREILGQVSHKYLNAEHNSGFRLRRHRTCFRAGRLTLGGLRIRQTKCLGLGRRRRKGKVDPVGVIRLIANRPECLSSHLKSWTVSPERVRFQAAFRMCIPREQILRG